MSPAMMHAPFPEDPYGRVKRLNFIANGLKRAGVTKVLDIGCGTGSQLTIPLAVAFPGIRFLGVDSDQASIEAGQAEAPGNLTFQVALDDDTTGFNVVIASEVLEHVDDPAGFLVWLRGRLRDGGRLMITVPNGFGPMEWASLTQTILTRTGVWPALQGFKRRLFGNGLGGKIDTLAVSPHVNFFTAGELETLFHEAGLKILHVRARTFLCGFLVDQILGRLGLENWNARIADHLPAWAVSDWMYELEIDGPPRPSNWKRGAWARFRRNLNLRQAGLAQ